MSPNVGVSVGNSFKYGVTFDWNSNDPNMTIPSEYQSLNETEWVSMSVINVLNTNVTSQMTMHYKNGTELIEMGITDVDTGEGNVTQWLVAANLNVSDSIYTTGMYSTWRINETIVKTYPDTTRDTNHLNMTMEQNITDVYQYSSMNFYWDRPTGVIVEMSIIVISQIEGTQTNMTAVIAITESNVWTIPELSTLILAPLMLLMLAVAIVSYKRRRLKTPIH